MIGTGTTETTTGSESQDIVKILRTSMIEHSLPLWSREGWDPSRGGFVERLDIEGSAEGAAPRRVRVQARQIYCFAKAADLGWYPQDGARKRRERYANTTCSRICSFCSSRERFVGGFS